MVEQFTVNSRDTPLTALVHQPHLQALIRPRHLRGTPFDRTDSANQRTSIGPLVLPWFALCAMLRRRKYDMLTKTAMRLFGSLEAEIRTIMWRQETATVKQVHRELIDWRDLAYTTVMTTMERLTEKGVLKREKRGLAYTYTLACSREEYAAQAVRQIIDEVLDGDARGLAALR